MIGLNDVFDKIVYINSRRRADRFIRMQRRLQERKIVAERIEATWGGAVNPRDYSIDAPRQLSLPEIGCFLSHRGLYERMKNEGWQKCLILEDDAEFEKGFDQLFADIYPKVPADWQMLYFGRWNFDKDMRKPEDAEFFGLEKEIHPRLWEAKRCWYTHAYAIDASIVDYLLAGTQVLRASIDGQLADLQQELRTYAIHPAIIKQDGSLTSIQLPA